MREASEIGGQYDIFPERRDTSGRVGHGHGDGGSGGVAKGGGTMNGGYVVGFWNEWGRAGFVVGFQGVDDEEWTRMVRDGRGWLKRAEETRGGRWRRS